MSIKFGDKFRAYAIIALFIFICTNVNGFEPAANDFINTYQHELYKSWLQGTGIKPDFPASFTNEKITKTFLDSQQQEINVEYDWQNGKITSQRERIPIILYLEEDLIMRPYLNFLERCYYRLHCADKIFLLDMIDHERVIFTYKGKTGNLALEQLWLENPLSTMNLAPVELTVEADTLIFSFKLEDLEEFTISFLKVSNFSEILRAIREIEYKKSKEIFPVSKKLYQEETEMAFRRQGLAEYIRNNFDTPPKRELLNNKISDIEAFLSVEFPEHRISNHDDVWQLTIADLDNKLSGNISVTAKICSDMIDIVPSNEFMLKGKNLLLNTEQIDLTNLSESEISNCVSYLPQLIYEHRAIGSKLLNFLLIHDDVPSTLVVRTDKRELYEAISYSDILLLLNQYWRDRTIYFGIENIKKVNNTIEFRGFLVARSSDGKSDLAEIFFHVSREYKIDLIMMILHPDKK